MLDVSTTSDRSPSSILTFGPFEEQDVVFLLKTIAYSKVKKIDQMIHQVKTESQTSLLFASTADFFCASGVTGGVIPIKLILF